jgi:hypothetical protein
LSYIQLKKIQAIHPEAIPEPGTNGELTVTLVGAGPAVEVYGLCLFYNESTQRLRKLQLNLIDKVSDWQPTRELIVSRLLKDVMPKVDIYSAPIEADITQSNCVQTFATFHDALVSTQLLFVYNVLNEIEVEYRDRVLRNLSYVIRQVEQPLLLLMAEPTVLKAWPRIKWFRELLLRHFNVLLDEPDSRIRFDTDPTNMVLQGINERLFSRLLDKNPPTFDPGLSRSLIACSMASVSPFSSQHYEQLRRTQLKRDRKGRITADTAVERQLELL